VPRPVRLEIREGVVRACVRARACACVNERMGAVRPIVCEGLAALVQCACLQAGQPDRSA